MKRRYGKVKPDLAPEHLIVRWANRMRAYYGHPVYMVGSQLMDKENPNDVDIICIIPDDEFETRFMNIDRWHQEQGEGRFSEEYWRWTERNIKDSLDGMVHTGWNIDFKVYCATYNKAFPEDKHPKKRLDTR